MKKSPGKRSAKAAPRSPRNYFMVNMSARNRAELEKLCREFGTNLKIEAYNALSRLRLNLQNRLAGKPRCEAAISVKLPLSLGEFRALKFHSRNHWDDNESLGNVAQYVLRLALGHPATVTAWIESLVNYCRSEDVDQRRFLEESVAARREYRRVKVNEVAS